MVYVSLKTSVFLKTVKSLFRYRSIIKRGFADLAYNGRPGGVKVNEGDLCGFFGGFVFFFVDLKLWIKVFSITGTEEF